MKLKSNLEIRQLTPKTFILESVDDDNFNKVVTFNASAAYLWKALSQKEFTNDDVTRLLVDRYKIDEPIARRDADSIIDSWQNASLIE